MPASWHLQHHDPIYNRYHLQSLMNTGTQSPRPPIRLHTHPTPGPPASCTTATGSSHATDSTRRSPSSLRPEPLYSSHHLPIQLPPERPDRHSRSLARPAALAYRARFPAQDRPRWVRCGRLQGWPCLPPRGTRGLFLADWVPLSSLPALPLTLMVLNPGGPAAFPSPEEEGSRAVEDDFPDARFWVGTTHHSMLLPLSGALHRAC